VQTPDLQRRSVPNARTLFLSLLSLALKAFVF
jgi:hypothetical protein